MAFFVFFELCSFKLVFLSDIRIVKPLVHTSAQNKETGLLNTAHPWILTPISSLCLLIGPFSSFTFKVNIVMCEFDSVIMTLAGYFVH